MDTLYPFYDKLADRLRISFAGKLILSILLGLSFLGLRYISVMSSGNATKYLFEDWSWFLALLITTVMLSLYYATHVFRNMLPEVYRRSPKDVTEKDILTPILKILNNRGFIVCGVFIGIINCSLGWFVFGLPEYTESIPDNIRFADSTLLFGFFLAGFVNGLAVFGIFGVLDSVKSFSGKIASSIDSTFPDRCGDTAFLGTALMVFSSVTLIAGVMISTYILKVQWEKSDTNWVIMAKWFWIAFPYVMSIAILVIPALRINKILRDYKARGERELRKKLVTLQGEIENPETDSKTRGEKQDIYNYFSERRKELYNMRTWPFSAGPNTKFLSFFSGAIYATFEGSHKWVEDNYLEVFKIISGN